MTKTFTLFCILSFSFISLQAQETVQKILYHDYNKTQLTSRSKKELDDLITQLKNQSVLSVSIVSYTDKSGTSVYNQTLSEKRSIYLLKTIQNSLPASVSYSINHFGEDKLLTSDNNEQAQNRRSLLIVTYVKAVAAKVTIPAQPDVELQPFAEDVTEQRYDINLDDSVFITGKDGTLIQFAPGTIQNSKGEIVTGQATVLLKEYYRPGDIMLSGTHSESAGGLLQTSGMFKLLFIKNGDTLSAKTKRPVLIKIPDINNLSLQMNVFTMNHGDTSLWNDTRRLFTYKKGHWNWPICTGKLTDFDLNRNLPYQRWQTGRTWRDEYGVSKWLFEFLQPSYRRTLSKHVSYTIVKKDSATLSVQLKETFRKQGVKEFYVKTFDTMFLIHYMPPRYETELSDLTYINCDRFLDEPVRINFYVKTPGSKGSNLMVYFRRLNAFMTVPYNKGKYTIRNVPPDEKVVLIAVGKNGDDMYCGKKEFLTAKNALTELILKPVKYEYMTKLMREVAYAK